MNFSCDALDFYLEAKESKKYLPEGMSRERFHLDLQSALLYPLLFSCSATKLKRHFRQYSATLPEQEQIESSPRIFRIASSVSALIFFSVELSLASIAYINKYLKKSLYMSCFNLWWVNLKNWTYAFVFLCNNVLTN